MSAGTPPRDGLWLVADRQTAGRGRLGRTWFDGHGNFMGSSVVALRPLDPPSHTLSLVTGVAVHRAVEALSPSIAATLKWPNDLLIGSAKIAGILLERVGKHVIVGVGVNLAQVPDIADRPVTSLARQGAYVSRNAFATVLAEEFERAVADWRTDWRRRILPAWAARAHPHGTALTITEGPDAGTTGLFDGLDADGALRLRCDTGETIIVHAGEIRIAEHEG